MASVSSSSVPVTAPPPVRERVRVQSKFFFRGDHKFFLKGITYGPFHPDAAGDFVGTPDKVRADLALMRELGVNLLRVYHVPPRWFMDILAEHGMLVMISIPWAEHVEFLNDRTIRKQVEAAVRTAVNTHRGHPAVFGYLVGNEIPTTMVRWLGVRRVTEFLEHLINLARNIDPAALYSYASYPPTEYLLPQNVDFCTFNVYLHNQRDFENYLLRLQNLADEKPCIMGEFGMDTIRHPAAGTGRHALLARRERRALRPRRDDHLRVDGRMVHRRHGHHRLGVRPGNPRAGSQARLRCAEGKMGRRATTSTSPARCGCRPTRR